MSNNIITFIDNVGRVIVGRADDEQTTDSKLAVSNPSVVNVNVKQDTGQITVQLLPYVFREFITPETRFDKHVWFFNKCQITMSDTIEVDSAVQNQYIGIFETPPAPQEPETQEAAAEVVELFDEEPKNTKKKKKK